MQCSDVGLVEHALVKQRSVNIDGQQTVVSGIVYRETPSKFVVSVVILVDYHSPLVDTSAAA
mgnify:CR=1 FL=1